MFHGLEAEALSEMALSHDYEGLREMANELRMMRLEAGKYEHAIEDALNIYEESGSADEMYHRLREVMS